MLRISSERCDVLSRFFLVILLASVFTFLFVACGQESGLEEEPVLGEPNPIYYGQTSPTLYSSLTTAQQNAVVHLGLYFGANMGAGCTGTLISPSLILTAAHCVNSDEYGDVEPENVVIYVGPNSDSPQATLWAQQVYRHPSWNGETTNDVAIIVLSNRYNGSTPIPIKEGGLSGLVNHSAQAVGFGKTQNTDNNQIRYWTTLDVDYVRYDGVTVNGHGQSGVAPGDSGGPLLYDFGQGVTVVGVASTSAEGWVYYANYASLDTNESWVQNLVNQWDNPACVEACASVDCGSYNGCSCGDCGRGYECVSNQCEEIPAGTGGACVTMTPSGSECTTHSQCGEGGACVQYGGNYSECGDICGYVPCSPSDNQSHCQPLPLQGGGYFDLCLESSPTTCSNEGTTCQTPDGRSGYCLQIYQNGPLACYGSCEPVITCPEGTGCMKYNVADCQEICSNGSCGTISGCECGSCSSGETCQNYRCVRDQTCEQICAEGSYECGWVDDCNCGSCSDNEACNDGQCLPTAEYCDSACQTIECGPYRGCNCGSCGANEVCEDSECVAQTAECLTTCVNTECGTVGTCNCGGCNTGEECRNGLCADATCQANCTGKQCGDDGCGGSCGNCTAPLTCVMGFCAYQSTCTPNCTGRQCGDDGCGGSCGSCAFGTQCDFAGTCQQSGTVTGNDDTNQDDQVGVIGSSGCGQTSAASSYILMLLVGAFAVLRSRKSILA